MTGVGLAVQGGLAALGLVIAYGTWQREPDRAAGEAVVIDVTKGDLANIHYEDDTISVDLERAKDGGETGVWLRVQDKTPMPAAPPPPKLPGPVAESTAAPPAPPPPKPRPLRQLRGDEPAEKLLTLFAPLHSPRAFGVLDAKKMKELGLDAAKKKLVVTARGEKREFVIGQPAQGGGESYLRDIRDGRTYLMPKQVLSDLQGAAHRLVDRKVHTFKIADIDRLVVSVGATKREFVVKNNKDQAAYKLAPASAPEKPEEMARNWHDKIWRSFPLEVLGKGETPAGGQPKIAARIDYFDGGKSIGWFEIGKLDVAPGPTPPTNPHAPQGQNNGVETYGRSEHTAGWVRLNNDPSALADAEKIAAGS